VIRILY